MSDSEEPKSSWKRLWQLIKHKLLALFAYLEQRCERLSVLLERWALLDVLKYVSRLGILVSIVGGVCVYLMEADERRMQAENERQQAVDQRKAKQYQAWQVIIEAQGQRVPGGRMDAIQDLHRDGISLVGLDISNAYLPGLNLYDANLCDANFAKAVLNDTNFAGAKLNRANLYDVNLCDANLYDADLYDANLAEAELSHAYLVKADLSSADLKHADLYDANLAGAELGLAELNYAVLAYANLEDAALYDANFTGANLHDAKLERANLRDANLSEAVLFRANLHSANLTRIKNWREIKSIEGANIYGVEHPPNKFIDWAMEHGALCAEDEEEWRKLLRERRQAEGKRRNEKQPIAK